MLLPIPRSRLVAVTLVGMLASVGGSLLLAGSGPVHSATAPQVAAGDPGFGAASPHDRHGDDSERREHRDVHDDD